MIEIVCEVANTTGKDITLELSIPEAEQPDVQILKSEQQIGIFAAPNGGTVQIKIISTEFSERNKELEAALREIIESARLVGDYHHVKIARAALGEKTDG
jgi:hypothetical protein